jgi:hypothetical protein
MPGGIDFTTCQSCNRGFSLPNPLVELTDTGCCPHCGQLADVAEVDLAEARKDRGEKPDGV